MIAALDISHVPSLRVPHRSSRQNAIAFQSSHLCRHQLARTEFCPLVATLYKALTADDIPFHLSTVVADVDVDFGLDGLEIWSFGEMRLQVLAFDGVIGDAAIDVVAVDADTHRLLLQGAGVCLSVALDPIGLPH